MTDFRSTFERQVAAARSLADDLEQLLQNGAPSPDALTDAPLINNWRIVNRPQNALAGIVDFHPRIGLNQPIVTSPIFALDPALHNGCAPAWARVWSRWYLLGKSADHHWRH